MLIGRDDNNNNVLVAVNSSNQLKVSDENNNSLMKWKQSNDLRYLRSQGNCYFISSSGTPTVTNDGYALLTLVNPTGSGKSIYLYNIRADISFPSGGGSGAIVQMKLHTGLENKVDGGVSTTSVNAKLNGPPSSITRLVNATLTAPYSTLEQTRIQDSNIEIYYLLDFQEEYIEIPEGYFISVQLYSTLSINIIYDLNLRYIEVVN